MRWKITEFCTLKSRDSTVAGGVGFWLLAFFFSLVVVASFCGRYAQKRSLTVHVDAMKHAQYHADCVASTWHHEPDRTDHTDHTDPTDHTVHTDHTDHTDHKDHTDHTVHTDHTDQGSICSQRCRSSSGNR